MKPDSTVAFLLIKQAFTEIIESKQASIRNGFSFQAISIINFPSQQIFIS